MKKSRIIALMVAAAMIIGVIPSFAADMADVDYMVAQDGTVLKKDSTNLILNPSFENGLTGLTDNSEYYAVSTAKAHDGNSSLQAIKSTKGDSALTARFSVSDAADSYYLSFWYLNTDSVARRPRVTFAFTDSSGAVPTEDDDFADETNAWIGAGNSSNDQGMEYSKGEWVKYSTIITGNGNAAQCAYAVLSVYGLTKSVTYVDDFEIYRLSTSTQYNSTFAAALNEWEANTFPKSPLAGAGTLDLPEAITSVSGVSVKWSCDSDVIDVESKTYKSGASSTLALLVAHVYMDGFENEIYKDYEYPYIVKSMFDPYVAWIGTVFDGLGSAVRSDLSLPTEHTAEGYDAATIEWVCSDSEVIASDGTFTPPETTKYVELTANIIIGEQSYSVTRRIKAIGGNIVPDGLVMYYDFESALGTNSTVSDNSGNNMTATADTGVSIVDGCAKFSGSASTITLPTNYGTMLPSSYSVSMWVKLDANIAASAGMYRFFDFGGGTYTSQFLRYVPSSGQISFMDRGTSGSASTWALDTTLSNIGNTWKLISFVYDITTSPATAYLYVDGALYGTSNVNWLTNNVAAIAGNTSTSGYIGRTQWNNGDNPDYMGLMDDVRIYDRAITADEISTLYEETRPTVTATVTLRYVDAEGNSLSDDVFATADVDNTYDVPASLKSLPSYSDDQYVYTYTYLSSRSSDSVYVTSSGENLCTLVFTLTKAPKGNNLISNPSFETGVEGWTSGNQGVHATVTGWTRSTEVAHEGIYSLKRGEGVGSNSDSNLATYIPIESGKVYDFSFWEYSDVAVAAGSHQMAAVCVTTNDGAVNVASNHLTDLGGFSSWVNEANGVARDPEYTLGWSQRKFTFDTTGRTDANYILVTYAWSSGGNFYLDDFSLTESGSDPGDDEPDTDEGEKVDVVLHYVDTMGNTIKDDVTVEANYKTGATNTYAVPASYKAIDGIVTDDTIKTYKYIASQSTESITLSIMRDNECTLVFDVVETVRGENIIQNNSFEDGTTGWTTANYATDIVNGSNGFSIVADATDGSYALQINSDVGSAAAGAMSTKWSVLPDTEYEFSVDIKHTSNDGVTGFLELLDSSSTSVAHIAGETPGEVWSGSGEYVPASSSWSTVTYKFTTTSDTVAVGLKLAWAASPVIIDNVSLKEIIHFENTMTYADGMVSILAADGTTGYIVEAFYDEEGILSNVIVHDDELTFNKETPVTYAVTEGAKVMLVKSMTSLEPICSAVVAE